MGNIPLALVGSVVASGSAVLVAWALGGSQGLLLAPGMGCILVRDGQLLLNRRGGYAPAQLPAAFPSVPGLQMVAEQDRLLKDAAGALKAAGAEGVVAYQYVTVKTNFTEDKWLEAIEKDKLSWTHISDLKGWQSEHAKLYSVSSIPQTLLIDRDGKIIQRNLRGEELRRKLEEIFDGKSK